MGEITIRQRQPKPVHYPDNLEKIAAASVQRNPVSFQLDQLSGGFTLLTRSLIIVGKITL
jgi:hypothetical protein